MSYSYSHPIKQFLMLLATTGSFSMGGRLRELYNSFGVEVGSSVKADHLSARSMFDAKLFSFGNTKVDSSLKPAVMARYHRTICVSCRNHCYLDPHCYFKVMLDCVIYGWYPPVDRDKVRPRYNLSNSRNTALFSDHVDKEFSSLLERGIVEPADDPKISIFNPIGVVIKNSDKQRARTLVGIEVTDSASLKRASEELISKGSAKIKCRIIVDSSASGVNDVFSKLRLYYCV